MIKIPFEDVVLVDGRHYNNLKNVLTVNWNLGTFCNYDCSYCWPEVHSKKYDFKSLGVYQLAIDNLVETAVNSGFKKIDLTILGGELTAYKNFVEFIKYIDEIKEIEFKINLTSNLSPSIKYWNIFIENVKNIKLKLTASYHIEFAELNSFLEKINFIESKGIHVTINVVMSPTLFDKLVPIAKEIKSKCKYFVFAFQYNNSTDISNNPEVLPYTQEMIDIINELNESDTQKLFTVETKEKKYFLQNGNILLGMNFTNYSGWDCDAGFNSIVVDRQLNVRRCHAGIDEPIGNLKSNFELKIKKCITSACICTADLKIKKTRNI